MHPVDVSGHVATFVGAVLAAPVCALEFAGVDVVLIGRLVFRFVERPGGKKTEHQQKRQYTRAI